MESWILPYVKKYKMKMMLTIFLGLLGVTSGAMLLFVSGYLISKSALKPENILLVYVPIVSVRAFSIGQAAFPYLERLLAHDVVLRILAGYRQRLYQILEPQAVFIQSRYKSGDILQVLSDDVERLQDFFIKTLFPSIVGLVIYGVLAVVIGFFDWVFMLLLLLILGIIVFLMPFLSYSQLKRQQLGMKRHRGKLYQYMADAIFGKSDWMISGRSQEVLQGMEDENNRLMHREHLIHFWHHMRDGILRFITGITIVLVMIWASIQAGDGILAPTVIAAFVLMMFSVTDALLPLSAAAEDIPIYQDALRRMERMEKKGTENASIHDCKHVGFSAYPTLNLYNVSYAYDTDSPPVINQLNLTISPGSKVAILGKSGTGKSTLLKLLSGLMEPDEGAVQLDDKKMHPHFLAEVVSVLNQQPHLFHTTIANNVRIGQPSATEAEVKNALAQAQVLKMIEQLPQGIHTQMDEMGSRFSGGERQRIALARVLLQDTPILLCDEPTTGLDPGTERALLHTIMQVAKEKTVIWVTHHLVGADLMDEIIFLRDGNVIMSGTHESLLAENTYYQQLYEMNKGF